MPVTAKSNPANALRSQADVHALAHAAHLANSLAKQLKGNHKLLAHRIKAECVNALVLSNACIPNGVRADAILGLDILSNPPSPIHIPLWHLQPEAQAMMRRSVTSVQAKAPLSQRLGPDQLQAFQQNGNRR